MNEDEIVVIFCSPKVEKELIEIAGERVKESLVVSKIIPDDEVTIVPKEEFLNWLKENYETKHKTQ